MLKKINRVLPATVWVLMLFVLVFSGCGSSEEPVVKSAAPSPEKLVLTETADGSKPVVIFYSRSGKTRIVADYLAKQINCEKEEIISKKNRQGFGGILTCVFDQIFNKYDDIEPVASNIKEYNPMIILSPIWIHKISSPARTFIRDTGLRGKDVHLVLTYNGSLGEEDENEIRSWVESHGINLKGIYKIITKKKTEKDLEEAVAALIMN